MTTQARCIWTAISNSAFVTITSGSSGVGSGVVNFTVLATGSAVNLSGTLTIAGQTFTVTETGTQQGCTFSISPTNQTFPATGGTGTVNVTTQSGCTWTAVSNSGFISITSGSSGVGSGVVTFSVAPTNTNLTLFGTLTIAGQTFTVTEGGSQQNCTFTITPTAQNFALVGGTGSVAVTSQSGCAFTATSNSSFITVTGGSTGVGNGTVTFTVAAATSPRTGTITIGGQTFTVNQIAGCVFSISPSSLATTQNLTTGGIFVTTQAGCAWTAVSNASFITITSGSSGTGSGTVAFFVQANTGFTRTGTITVAGFTFTVTQTGPFGLPSCPAVASVSGISPSNGPVGTVVVLTGSSFTGVTSVKFGGISAFFTVNSDTQLIATVPAGATSGQIVLTKANCGDISVGAFTVLNCTSTIPVTLPTSLTATVGNTITVPITVPDLTGKGILSYDFTVSFDPTQLSLQASPVDQTGTLSNGVILAVNTNVPGQLRVSAAATSALSGAGTLINLKFNVIGGNAACATLNMAAFQFNEGNPCVTTNNGQICRGSASISGVVNYAITPQPVTGVTLTAAGTPSATFTTGHNGAYQFTTLGTGPYTVTPAKSGDINGSIDAFDASLVLRAAAGLITLTPSQQIAGDASGNGTLTAFDAALIAQFSVGIPNTSVIGTWVFVPSHRTYPTLFSDQTGQNYDAILVGDVSGNWVTAIPAVAPADGGQSKTDQQAGTDVTTAPISVSLPVTTGSPQGNLTVPITVGNLTNNGVFSYDLDISYDPTVLQATGVGVDSTSTLSSGFTVISNATSTGHILVAAFGTAPLSGSGTLLNLTFKVAGLNAGTSPLTWQKMKFNDGTPSVSTVSGGFTIGDPCAAVISPGGKSFNTNGGSDSVTISISAGCPMATSTSSNWITVGSVTNSKLNYSVAANNSSAARSGTITIDSKTFMVVQTKDAQTVLYGDINHDGKVDIQDLILLANHLAGNAQIDPSTADVAMDGKIDIVDLVTLANFLAGNTPVLPIIRQ